MQAALTGRWAWHLTARRGAPGTRGPRPATPCPGRPTGGPPGTFRAARPQTLRTKLPGRPGTCLPTVLTGGASSIAVFHTTMPSAHLGGMLRKAIYLFNIYLALAATHLHNHQLGSVTEH